MAAARGVPRGVVLPVVGALDSRGDERANGGAEQPTRERSEHVRGVRHLLLFHLPRPCRLPLRRAREWLLAREARRLVAGRERATEDARDDDPPPTRDAALLAPAILERAARAGDGPA